jgi:Polyketide cyclase / dehydrase and lipid transport
MVKTIAIVVGVLLVVSVAGVLLLAVSKPDTFRVQRATSIKAPSDRIFPLIADFHGWSAWSPYEKLDPAMKRTFGGADKGKGAVYEWESDGKAGKGRMEITDAPAPSKVTIKLDFLKPFESHNTAEFKLEPSGDSTELTWAMYGPNLFIGKVMSIFFDMDKMIGKDFETGLANLKTLAEQKPDATTSRR